MQYIKIAVQVHCFKTCKYISLYPTVKTTGDKKLDKKIFIQKYYSEALEAWKRKPLNPQEGSLSPLMQQRYNTLLQRVGHGTTKLAGLQELSELMSLKYTTCKDVVHRLKKRGLIDTRMNETQNNKGYYIKL